MFSSFKCFFKGHDYVLQENVISGVHSLEALQLIKMWEAMSGQKWGPILQLVEKRRVCRVCGKNKGFVGFDTQISILGKKPNNE